jgi:hypothetical protein
MLGEAPKVIPIPVRTLSLQIIGTTPDSTELVDAARKSTDDVGLSERREQTTQTYVAALQAIISALPGIKAQAEAVPTGDKGTFQTAARAITAQFLDVTRTADAQVQTLDAVNLSPSLQDCGGVYAPSSVLPGNESSRPPPSG